MLPLVFSKNLCYNIYILKKKNIKCTVCGQSKIIYITLF